MSADFLLGATAFGCLVVALFFGRFWRVTGDRFFMLMAGAFAVFGLNRIDPRPAGCGERSAAGGLHHPAAGVPRDPCGDRRQGPVSALIGGAAA